jgi:DNA polymerase V
VQVAVIGAVGSDLWEMRNFSHQILGMRVWLPLFPSKVPAGFPSPVDDFAEGSLDLNEYLVEHEAATFYVRVKGHSMSGVGILDNDVIAVDRALDPRHGDFVVAVLDGEL